MIVTRFQIGVDPALADTAFAESDVLVLWDSSFDYDNVWVSEELLQVTDDVEMLVSTEQLSGDDECL
jgi:hypothetical protein